MANYQEFSAQMDGMEKLVHFYCKFQTKEEYDEMIDDMITENGKISRWLQEKYPGYLVKGFLETLYSSHVPPVMDGNWINLSEM